MKFCYLKTSLIWKLITTTMCQCFETVLVCPWLSTNTASLQLQSLLSQFFFPPKIELPNWGCSLSMAAAYTWTFTVTIIARPPYKGDAYFACYVNNFTLFWNCRELLHTLVWILQFMRLWKVCTEFRKSWSKFICLFIAMRISDSCKEWFNKCCNHCLTQPF